MHSDSRYWNASTSSPFHFWERILKVVFPIFPRLCSTVVIWGLKYAALSRLSKPVTRKSLGILNPWRSAAEQIPAAILSFAQTKAPGRGFFCSTHSLKYLTPVPKSKSPNRQRLSSHGKWYSSIASQKDL